MKKICIVVLIALAGCQGKTNEGIAKELITANLKFTLPDFKAYSSLNFGNMGKAFLSFEESESYLENKKAIAILNDSISHFQQLMQDQKRGLAAGADIFLKDKLKKLTDGIALKNEAISAARQVYVPVEIYKMTHAYTIRDNAGLDKKTEQAFYFDKGLKGVIKVKKIY